LTQALKDSDAGVRQWAVAGLLNLQGSPKEALPLLVQALQDDITAVREAAAVTLGHFGPAAVPQLIEALKDKEEPVWNKAAKSLKNLKGPPAVIVRALKDAMQHDMVAVRRGAAYALSSFGSDAVDPLIAGLTDKDWGVRWEAADSLRVVGTTGEKALPLLAGLAVSDPEAKVRKIAVEAMLTMQGLDRFRDLPHQAVPELIKGLETRDADGRYQAALVLEAIGPRARDAVPALTKAAQDKDPRVRKAALAALERMK
jgi:HEAT repeat protein